MPYKQIIASLFHASAPVGHKEKIVSAISAFVAILLTGILSASLGKSALPLMIASMGASSVLLFAAPHSPMAQPWSFIGGHMVSAFIGISCYMLVPNPFVAAALAVALAIFAMHWLRCLHPPGGATSLAMVISGQEMHALGYGALLSPVGLDVLILMIIALAVNNLFPGRRYPMLAPAAGAAKPAAPAALTFGRMALNKEDLESALKDMNAYIDVAEGDLEEIYNRASLHHMRRHMGEVICRDIMTRDVGTAEYGDELSTVWEMMRQRKLKGVPVVDRARRVIGIVTIVDFLKRVDETQHAHPRVLDRMRAFIRRTTGLTTDKPEVVGQIMSAPVMTAREDTHIVSLIPLFSEHNIHHVPIVDKEGRVTGMVTQTDLSVALYRYWAAMP
ncbi:membrane protein [Sulfuricaulis limicola]|uniref:Membrane protein n=1 Tax=Sulfuricaulis limicola TaxID=1620215 RepID=A0A1B4XFN3_9GAMM|nr:HPP family protein [Sulfuricaulis limicola]BAV33602.1 membrane protein [Sulfuricaulis limicola]